MFWFPSPEVIAEWFGFDIDPDAPSWFEQFKGHIYF